MKLSAPKMITWWIAVILGVLGILGHFAKIPVVSTYSAIMVGLGFVILAVATVIDGL